MKKIKRIIMAAGLLLLASCGPQEDVGPIEHPNNVTSPENIVVPTCTPTATVAPEPVITKAADVTVVPTSVPEPTEEPTVMPTVAPTVTAEPTQIPEPTLTAVPEPTEDPEPTEAPQPTLSPTPALDPETLVNNGWQKTVSIDEKYIVVFPELFRESTVVKENNELVLKYTSQEEPEIEFRISYMMKQTLQDVENEILSIGGTILEGSLGDKRVVLQWLEDGTVYYGMLLEEQYPQTLLGGAFGEDEWITGVMQVVFLYPEERQEEFETMEYSYHIKQNREE